MSLFDRIGRIFKREKAATTTLDLSQASAPAQHMELAERFRADRERAQIMHTCRKMYADDTRAKGVLKAIARDAIKGGFRVMVTNNLIAQEIAEALTRRLKLVSVLDDWVRMTLRDGDSFIEVGIDEELNISAVTRKPTLQMRRNSDATDRFSDPARAFWQSSEVWYTQEAPREAIWYAEWQMIHARWDHDEGSRYGTPLFASATAPFRRMTEGEMDIAVRRKTRAGMRYVHSLEGANESEIERYREMNKAAFDPKVAIADFFTNKKTSISTVQGDANLNQIEDVLHHIRTWWVASPAPMSLLGYGQDMNRDVLDRQDRQYSRAIEQITQWVEAELVTPLLERQWLLKGILPEGLDYEIEWMSKDPLTATDIRDVADAVLRLQAARVSPNAIEALLRKFIPGVEISVSAEDSGEAETMANAADALRKRL